MKQTLLSFLLLLTFHFIKAQAPIYQLKSTIGSTPSFDLGGMAVDAADNIYVIDKTKIMKMKEGKLLFEFSVELEEYASPYIPDSPWDITVDDEGNIYLVNRAKKRIEKHDSAGNLLKTFGNAGKGPEEYTFPGSIHYNKHLQLCIFDASKRKIFVYNTDGEYLKSIALTDPAPEYSTDEMVISIDKQAKIYVAESKMIPTTPSYYSSKDIVTVQNQDGEILQRLSEEALQKSGLLWPDNLGVDNNGDIYISNISPTVNVFSSAGNFKKKIKVNPGTDIFYRRNEFEISFDSQNNLYLGSYSKYGSAVQKFNANHQFIEQWGSLRRPFEVVLDKQNDLYVLDHFKNEVVKMDLEGQELLVFGGMNSNIVKPQTLAVDDQGYIYILDIEGTRTFIKKFDATGNHLRSFDNIAGHFEIRFETYVSAGLAVDYDGNMYVTSYNTNAINKYSPQGILIATFGSMGKGAGQLWGPLDVSVDAGGYVYVTDINGNRIQKFSSTGKFLQQYGSFRTDESDARAARASITTDALGNTVVSSLDGHVQKVTYYDMRGKVVSSLPEGSLSVSISADGKFIAAADNYKDVIKIYSTTTPLVYNIIQGSIYHDSNQNCVQDANEPGLPDVKIKAEPGPYYGITDALGYYNLAVGKGTFTIEPLFEKKIGKNSQLSCLPSHGASSITFDNFGNNIGGHNIGLKVDVSPYLSVSVSSDRRRRCFESTTKLTYSNTGYAPAENAKVYLQLPEQVELLSADKPYTRLPNGTYVFDAGTVAAGQKSIITIQDKVVCGDESIRGMTVCTRVWITPGNQSPTAPPAAVISITGTCNPETGKVRFVIRNTGKVDMEESEQFRKYINGLLSTVEDYRLAAGDSMVLWVPAGGRTVRLEADQPEGNSDNTMASTTVEACSTVATRTAFSSGFVNILPSDDEEAEVAEECLPIIDSFDPNDKLVLPVGLTDEKYTPTGVALKYKIRFQNTGTDVAYRVVVVDTLSEHLDLSTLQIGSASHAYRYELSGKGKAVLTWTFDNIMLPDSTSNEPGSHGYIQFSIKPKADLREKTAVENYADIFFDYNSPVRTNTIVNRIYDMPPVINESVRMDLEQIIATPGIVTFAPAAGKYGTEVTISGKKFSATAASNKVYINGVLASVVSASETELRVLVPASATTGALRVITPDGGATTADAFEVYQPPVLSGFSPVEGIVGSAVTLQGKHLDPAMLHQVTLGGLSCDIISNTDQGLVVKVPEEALTSPFEIVTKGGETHSASAYVVWHQPSISSLSKISDAVGATIYISGNHFAPSAERNKVLFGLVVAQVLQSTADQLTVKVPQGATSGYITVETPGGKAVSSISFEVIPAPAFISMVPSKGSVGTEVEIKGLHFGVLGVQDEIRFNGEKALVLEASDATYKVRVPRGATSGKISITGVGGATHSIDDFVVEALTPAQAIVVYPNPSTGLFTISFLHADFDVQAVQVFDTIGKLLHTVPVANPRPEKLEMDLGNAKAGLYVLQIKTDRGMVTKKLNILY